MDYKIQLSTAQLEPPEEQRRRFEIECEFVQALANPHYVNFLAQRGFLKEQHFINYLKYLLYWKQPEYARVRVDNSAEQLRMKVAEHVCT
ncbi:hypothetical protein Y032_0576g217 [Ancylostoma ceylanicum]|nr:hypothetical protein Y032_0576g217 [Ancylostoma ceylanicum]